MIAVQRLEREVNDLKATLRIQKAALSRRLNESIEREGTNFAGEHHSAYIDIHKTEQQIRALEWAIDIVKEDQ